MNGDPDEPPSLARLEDDQELWQLLGRAKQAAPGAYFARRVLREAAALSQSRPASALWRGLQTWWRAGLPLLRPPRAAAWPGAFAAVAICAVTVLSTFSGRNADLPLRAAPSWHPSLPKEAARGPSAATPDAGPGASALRTDDAPAIAVPAGAVADEVTPQDAEVIVDLDTLMAREETHLWTDDSPTY